MDKEQLHNRVTYMIYLSFASSFIPFSSLDIAF